ncbi:uncharacterized protein LOC127852424 [Dreissena polymorpha]|uniref:uncharacterized protein LOC127852424 n=1 Tax=Dreissena polymorpha TaxID=45954 RepID=UPI0022643340|nr:uncharacterized protein LOC127852424 [Dreissena polymorpha]
MVDCEKDNTNTWADFTTGHAVDTKSVFFYADKDPPFHLRFGNHTYIGMSVKGTGQNVNKVDSNPIDELDDNDKNRYYIGDAKETRTWLEINADDGHIRVSAPLDSETAKLMFVQICVENRRLYTVCQVLEITIYHSFFTSWASIARLHENTDREKLIWRVTATIDITFTCNTTFTCAETHDSDKFTLNDPNNLYYGNHTGIRFDILKRKCEEELCEPCYIAKFCTNENEIHPYTIDCEKANTDTWVDFTTGHAVNTSSVYFYTDVHPPFHYINGTHVVVLKNDSAPNVTVINIIISDPVNEDDDNDKIFYYTEIPPRPSWIHHNILFELDNTSGVIYLVKPLDLEFSYTFNMTTCVHNRRKFINCSNFDITLWSCYQTPNCSNQVILDLNDTHGIDPHSSNDSLFMMIYPSPSYHFPNFRGNWSNLTWTLDKGTFGEATINPLTGEIYLTRNISIWPAWPNKTYNMTVTVDNSESCYTTTCEMDVTIWYTNWKPSITTLPNETSLHEDRDEEIWLHNLEVYDYNYDRSSDNHTLEDNITCWIDYVHDEWGENDTELFDLRQEDPSNLFRWNSYKLYKKACNISTSPYTPPCGYLRENFTCPKHHGCMTHNVTQKYDVSIICQDGYGAQDNRNFTFHVLHNEAPRYLNLPKTITLDLRKGSEHDIIFSTMYIDKENENLTFNYHFYEHDSKENVTYFKGDSSGNYYNQLGNISLTTFTYDTPKNTTYRIQICGHERRNEICEILTVELKDYCGPTPECRSATLNVTTELDPYHEIFDVNALVYNATAFTGLEYSLATRHLYLFNIDSLGVITTTATLPASYPYTTYVLNAFVNDINSCSSYSVCPLFLNVKYINYPLTINNLKTIKNPKTAEVHIHEDEDTSLALFTIETEDRNVDDDVICAIINPDDNKPFYMKETFTGSNVFVIKNHVAETDQERKLSAAKLVYHIEISCNDSLGEGDSGELIVNVTENKGPRLKAFIHNGKFVLT